MKPAVQQKIKQLRSEALDLVQQSDYRRAIAKFTQLEALDPGEPDWPRRAADCHRMLGARADQLAALGRAAEGYVRAGMVVKAMAIGKVMLTLDPGRAASLDWMNKLELPLGMSLPTVVAAPGTAPAKPQPSAPAVVKPEAAIANPHSPSPGFSKPEPSPVQATTAQRLAAERGLIGVARAALRQVFQDRRSPSVEGPSPAGAEAPPSPAPASAEPVASTEPVVSAEPFVSAEPVVSAGSIAAPPVVVTAPSVLPSSPPSSGGWQMLDDADIIVETESQSDSESKLELTSEREVLSVRSVSLPPLAADVNLHELVPGSRSMQATGKPSGMFRLAIDVGPPRPEDLARQQAREVLPAVPVFSEIDPPSLAKLVEQSRLLHLGPGEVVFRQDDAPECFYVIVNGSVVVIDEAASGKELYQLRENEFFGEEALLSNEPRPASVHALEECDLLAFDREAMRTCIASNPSVVPVLLRFLRSRMIEHLFQTSPLFTTFETPDRRGLTRRFEFIELSEGARLIEQGERAPGLFVLLSGALDVIRREGGKEIWLATLERSGVVGEMSLLKRTPAIADVRSATGGFALMLPAEQFRDVIMTHPPFLEVLTELIEERERANAQQLGRAR